MTRRRPELLRDFISDEGECVYLPEKQARLRYRLIMGCPAEEYQELLVRGWRRFGCLFFRPMCADCTECRSLRIEVEAFRASRSQRRVLAQNRDLEVVLRRPRLTVDHLELHRRYHEDMTVRRGWPGQATDAMEYFRTFVDGAESFGYEMAYLLDGRLVAVALTDVLPSAASSVYCYYDPRLRRRSLGTFSILQQIQLARRKGLTHLYLGFRITGNHSMVYKSRFQPHQLLAGRPPRGAEPAWRPPGTEPTLARTVLREDEDS